jgi:hypothetical protein
MTPEQIKQAVKVGKDLGHRREYENALAVAGRTGPDWNDLTEEQRERIREHNREFWKDMHDLGEEIRRGAT